MCQPCYPLTRTDTPTPRAAHGWHLKRRGVRGIGFEVPPIMPYFEFHDTLPHHIKTRRLSVALRLSIPQTVGHLACLFAYAIGTAPHGELQAGDIPLAAQYRGEGGRLVKALIESGWLDLVEKDTYQIHDWLCYTRAYRKAQRDSKARSEARQKRDSSAVAAQPPPRTERPEQNRTSGTNEQNERPTAPAVPLKMSFNDEHLTDAEKERRYQESRGRK